MVAAKERPYDEIRENIAVIQQTGCRSLYTERNINASYEDTKRLIAWERRLLGKSPPDQAMWGCSRGPRQLPGGILVRPDYL